MTSTAIAASEPYEHDWTRLTHPSRAVNDSGPVEVFSVHKKARRLPTPPRAATPLHLEPSLSCPNSLWRSSQRAVPQQVQQQLQRYIRPRNATLSRPQLSLLQPPQPSPAPLDPHPYPPSPQFPPPLAREDSSSTPTVYSNMDSRAQSTTFGLQPPSHRPSTGAHETPPGSLSTLHLSRSRTATQTESTACSSRTLASQRNSGRS